MLIRQFSLFLPGAYALSVMTTAQYARIDLRQGTALLLPVGMLLPLIILWGGPNPQNRLRERVHQVSFFHPELVNYLVLATEASALPLAVLRAQEIFRRQRLLIITILAPLFWLAIPSPNAPILNLPIQTLGYLDIALTKAFGDHKVIPYFLLWLLGGLILCEGFSIEWGESNKLILFAIAAFFVMNLFTHMVWDKYLLLVLPLLFLSLARGHARSTAFVGA